VKPVGLRELLQASTTVALDVDATGRLLVASNETGTPQLSEVDHGRTRALTNLHEPVSGRYLPGQRAVLLEMDAGGDERHQLYLLDIGDDDVPVSPSEVGRLRALTTDPDHVHHIGGVTAEGAMLAYTTNRRNGVDFDVWIRDLQTGCERPLFEEGGWCEGAGFSPDGKWLAALRPGPAPMDTQLLLLEVTSGRVLDPLQHGEPATASRPVWLPDSSGGYLATNSGREFDAIVRFSVDEEEWGPVSSEDHDLACVASSDGSLLAVIANVEGRSDVRMHAGAGLAPLGRAQLPEAGVVWGPKLPDPVASHDGSALFVSFSSPRLPGDVFRVDRLGTPVQRLTRSRGSELANLLPLPSWDRVTSFDGERIPVAFYRPDRRVAGGWPAVVVVHGGPESQSISEFNPVIQGLVARGYAVAVPNVRGSTGYGRRYYSLDDTIHRLDSVADLAAIHAWLPTIGVDPDRIALWGGSYGGYMVLAGLAFQPDLWACGVDIVGISDLVTFLENTSAYRRSHREREYGSLVHDREFLERASPLRQVEAIKAPLFVIHGSNDPRVPLGEAEQIAASLRSRDVPCELHVYTDEGHGLAKLANRLDAYPKAFQFLDRYLRPG
jgi:dipeptidyl aminopeptidase/acylaminoacyl peptidase